MTSCPKCSHSFHSDAHDPPTHCPACGAKLRRDAPSEWVPVARLADMTDSGYFSDVLRQHEIEVRVHEVDEFSALLGLWEVVFVLQVPRDDAERAIDLVRAEIEGGHEEPADHMPNELADPVQSESYFKVPTSGDEQFEWPGATDGSQAAPLWKSVALVLVVGSLAYGVGRSTARRDAAEIPQDQRDALWQALSQPGETFGTEGPPGARRYRLRYDAPSDQIHMEEDIDGDGRYDRRQVFERGRLVNGR